MFMHHLQKYILDRLRFEQPLSYSDMLPDGVVSSHFQYHLKSLQNEGLVQKESRGQYSLTHAGQAALEYLSVGRINPVRMPKVVTYTLLTHGDQMLLLQKQKEPYRHLIEPIAGKIHFGEDASAAAQREVLEKTGLHIPQPALCGVADMMMVKDGKPLTHMTAYAHHLELPEMPAELPPNTMLVTPKRLQKEADFVPGTPRLIAAIRAAGDTPFVITIIADV